jgi:TonB family protein
LKRLGINRHYSERETMSPPEPPPFWNLRRTADRVLAAVIVTLFATPMAALGDQKSKAALIDEILALSNARNTYAVAMRKVLDQARLSFKMQRNLIARQLQPAHPSDDQQSANKKELDAILDEYEARLNEIMAKATSWESIKTQVFATYDDLFSEEELAGIVAFYKTTIGQAYARKMPDFTAGTAQWGKEAAQALKPEMARLVQQTLEKAGRLGYTAASPTVPQIREEALPPPSSGGVLGGVPGGTAAGVIGGIIGSVPTAPPPAPLPPPDASNPVTPQRIRVGGFMQQAKLIQQAKPVYPTLAKQARISGVVKLNAVIGKDGTIQNLTVASGHPLLVPAAMEAVKQWVYQPTLLNGEPVEVVTQIEVNFTLSQDEPVPAQGQVALVDTLVKLVERGDLAGLRARLSSGANPNASDDSVVKGWTPLMAAAYSGNVDAARLLLDSGAAIDAKTQQGSTALDIAVRGGKPQVSELLRRRAEPANANGK